MSNLKDYATSTVLTPPSPADSGTSLVVQSGHGDRFPAAPFYVTVHPPSEFPTLDNAEKLLVSSKSTDTFTITRGEADTSPLSIEAGWRISNALFLDDIPNTFDDLTDGTTNKAFTGTLKTKLDEIEALADVTDSVNVDAAGATMNTDTNVKSNSWVLDQDNMSGNDDTKVPTQQSVKAYVDGKVDFLDDWDDWTPTLTNITLGNGSIVARYKQIGKTVTFYFKLTRGSTTSFSSQPMFSPPVAPSSMYNISIAERFFRGHIEDSGTASYVVMGGFYTSGNILMQVQNANGTYAGYTAINNTVPMAWATNDIISLTGTYEAA